MEESGRGRRSLSREMMTSRSPERGKVGVSVKQMTRPAVVIKPSFRKVQVVYYLSRNGLLEHPHYMEVTHLAHHHLRLKDVMDRLTALRGKGMPYLYSWSCKRSYKNGYVWNDMAENDIIYPSEGGDYVLKGSELLIQEKFQQLQLRNISQQVPDPTFHQKRKPVSTKRHSESDVDVNDNSRYEEEEEEEDDDDDNQDYEDKTRYTCSMTPPQNGSRCSTGVSTHQIELTHKHNTTTTTELTLDESSPPSATSSTVSDKANENNNNNNTSMRFEDGDPVAFESSLSRNSVLLQLISCGGSFRAMKTVPIVREQPPCTAARKSTTGSSLHKGVLCKTAAAAKVVVEASAEEEEEADMISCMSENPRFGNLQGEEKEYFSGSIVEAMGEDRVHVEQPMGLKRSNSYNEERCCKVEAVEYEPKREKAAAAVKAKCIPRMKSSSKQIKK